MPSRITKRCKPVPKTDQDLVDGPPTDPSTDASAKDKPDLRAADLQGLKFFKKIWPLLDSLHEIGTGRDKSHNRDLHMDPYGVLVLMWMVNPILTSLRGLQQASTLKNVQKKFGSGELHWDHFPNSSPSLTLNHSRELRRSSRPNSHRLIRRSLT